VLFADRISVPAPALIRFPAPPITPLKFVTAVLVTVSVLFSPFRVTLPSAVNKSGLLPARVTEALFRTTALFRNRPPTADVWSEPLVRVKVPVPRAALLPRLTVVPFRAAVPVMLLAVGRASVPVPLSVRFVALTGVLMVALEPALVSMMASLPRTNVPPPVMVAPLVVPVISTAPLVTVRVTPELIVRVASPSSVSELIVLLEETVSDELTEASMRTLSEMEDEPLTVAA
jgi:hypothetical protein